MKKTRILFALSALCILRPCWSLDADRSFLEPSKRSKRQISASRIFLESWNNCDRPRSSRAKEWPIHMTDLLLSKHPVNIPGQIKVKLEARINQPINTQIVAQLSIKRDFLIFKNVKIPCLNISGGRKVGSCKYLDICQKGFLNDFVKCSTDRCQCAVPTKRHHDLVLNLNIPRLPRVERKINAEGTYKVTAKFFDSRRRRRNGEPLLCVKLTARVE